MINIQFTKPIIKKVKSYHFQADQLGSVLFILFSLYENQLDLLDEFDDANLQKRVILLYKDMEMKGLLVPNTEAGGSYFHLSKEGEDLVEFIKSEFKNPDDVSSSTILSSNVDISGNAGGINGKQEVEDWIEEWVELFPKGVKTFGKLVRSDRLSCLRKMKVFMHEYKYDRDTIMEATRRYVDTKAQDGYNYMRCAVYFISRIDKPGEPKSSDLAAWCAQVVDDGNTTSSNNLEIMA